MKPLIYLGCVLLSLVAACNQPHPMEQQKKASEGFKFVCPKVIDSIKPNALREENSMQTAEYSVRYIGKANKNISLKYPEDYFQYVYGDNIFKGFDGIVFIVDTSQVISSNSNLLFATPPPWHKKRRGNNKTGDFDLYKESMYKSYPVFAINTTKDSLPISDGYCEDYQGRKQLVGYTLHLVMEAVDTDGKWKPIEKSFDRMCGTGLVPAYVPPGEVMITAANIYKGDYKTKLRLRIDCKKGCTMICSNVFEGTINRGQFIDKEDN